MTGWAAIKSFRGALSSVSPAEDYYAEIVWRGNGYSTLRLTCMSGQLPSGFQTFKDSDLIFCETREEAFALHSKIQSAYTDRQAKTMRAYEICDAAIGKIAGEAGKE